MDNGGTVMRGHRTLGGDAGAFGGAGSSAAFGPSVLPNANQLVTDWYIAPVTGNNANAGTSPASPLKSMAEIRRRIWGARYGAPGFPTVLTIHALESSTLLDDGYLYGFITEGNPSFAFGRGRVVILGASTVLFSGTLTAGTVGYVGNNRGLIFDTALPVSWTASGGISTTAGSRFIRTVGGGKQAPILLDMGAKSAMVGIAGVISETDVISPLSVAQTTFVTGDNYQVVSRISWPMLNTGENIYAQMWCLDIANPGAVIQAPDNALDNQLILCGVLSSVTIGGTLYLISSIAPCPFIAGDGQLTLINSSLKQLILELGAAMANWNGQDNVFLGCEVRFWHAGQLISSGTMRCFDTAFPLLSMRYGSTATINSIVGSNNTGKLLLVGDGTGQSDGNVVVGAELITATTSDVTPYTMSGTSYAYVPGQDGEKGGNAIYRSANLVLEVSKATSAYKLKRSQGLIAETFPHQLIAVAPTTVANIPTGSLFASQIYLTRGDIISKVNIATGCANGTSGTSVMTFARIGLYDAALNLVASCADTGAAWNTVGMHTANLIANYVVPADGIYYLGLVALYTVTPPAWGIMRLATPGFNQGFGSPVAGFPVYHVVQTGIVDLPNPAVNNTALSAPQIWMAVS